MFLDSALNGSEGRFFSAFGLPFFCVFVLGLALGTLLPQRVGMSWFATATQASVSSTASSSIPSSSVPSSSSPPISTETTWARSGNAIARYPVEVVRVLDGDTFEARVHLWPGLNIMTRVRLRGIDAPELKASCAQELQMAETASKSLQVFLAEGDVSIFNIGPDKYNGRVVADTSTRQTSSLSRALLASGQVRSYTGGRRSGWCDSGH
jgi:endonuclease YncB( thermonuclease family)